MRHLAKQHDVVPRINSGHCLAEVGEQSAQCAGDAAALDKEEGLKATTQILKEWQGVP
jgi:hypothetical protein